MKANDSLKHYTCTENLYQHRFGITFTDGVRALCDMFECYWFLDIVTSYQPELKGEESQVWELKRHINGTATVICTDGNDKILKQQDIPYTDFKADEATIWVEFDVALLTSER
jgi:hypothetical protein